MPAVALSPVLGVAVRAAPRAAPATRRRAPILPTQLSTSTTTRLTRPRKHHAVRVRCSTAPRASAAGAVPPPPPPRPSASKSGDGEHDATSAPLSSPARAPPGLLRHAQRAALATAVFVFFTAVVLAVQGAAVTSAWDATLDLRAFCASGVDNVCRYVYASQAAQAAAMAFFVFTPTLNKWCRSGFNSAARSLAFAGEVRPWVTASVQMSGQGVFTFFENEHSTSVAATNLARASVELCWSMSSHPE